LQLATAAITAIAMMAKSAFCIRTPFFMFCHTTISMVVILYIFYFKSQSIFVDCFLLIYYDCRKLYLRFPYFCLWTWIVLLVYIDFIFLFLKFLRWFKGYLFFF
jgi:hypothetical protein